MEDVAGLYRTLPARETCSKKGDQFKQCRNHFVILRHQSLILQEGKNWIMSKMRPEAFNYWVPPCKEKPTEA